MERQEPVNTTNGESRSCDELRKKILKKKKKSGSFMPAWVQDSFNMSEFSADGYPCYILKPRTSFHGEYIFYIYGSGLCFEMSNRQWNFILKLAENIGMGVVIPFYPLAPEKSCQDVFQMILPAYRDFSVGNDINKITIMGEGAGAGISLSLAIQIWKEGYRKPDKMVFLSPSLDTEFFDTNLEEKMRRFQGEDDLIFSDAVKEFLNRYWVKDYAARTEFTSPIYEDVTDLCDDILIISGTADMVNCYARCFYDKCLKNGCSAKYFEYKDMPHQFYLDAKLKEAVHAEKVIEDVLTDKQDAILHEYMFEVKQRGEWTKQFPEVFKDDIAVKYLCNNRITYEKYKKESEYQNLLGAARQHGFDEAVKKFLLQYPNGTVVYLGCSLDTMFERTDNGRVLWYNCDSPGRISIRRTYISDKEREKTVDKSLNDDSWMDEIKCDMGQGLLFVCMDYFSYLKTQEVQNFVDKLYQKFPGAHLLFDVSGRRFVFALNRYNRHRSYDFKRRKFYMNDVVRDVATWNIGYKVIYETSVFSGIKAAENWSKVLRMKFLYHNLGKSYKLVHLRLGNEKYKTTILI